MTKYDLLLLGRVRKILIEEAAVIHRSHTPWAMDAASKDVKRRHDRILREARDLADLRQRMVGTERVDPVLPPAPAVTEESQP